MSKYGIQTRGTGAVMGRSSYADGGVAGGIGNTRKKQGPRSGRPSGKRKLLPPFANQAIPDSRPKSAGPRNPDGRKNPPKSAGPQNPDGRKNTMPKQRQLKQLDLIMKKRLQDLLKKRKGLDPENPKVKKSIEDLKKKMRRRPKTMIPLKGARKEMARK